MSYITTQTKLTKIFVLKKNTIIDTEVHGYTTVMKLE